MKVDEIKILVIFFIWLLIEVYRYFKPNIAETKVLVEPEIEVVIKNNVADTTYIYKFERK